MVTDHDFLIPAWPDALQHVDVVKARFVLDFISPCLVQPADFLDIGRILRSAGKLGLGSPDAVAVQQWKALFEPALSEDPVARRKFQKPAPAFVITMPVMQKTSFVAGDQLDLEVLFVGTGIPLIHEFLRSLIHLGHLGLVAGKGCFEVTRVCERDSNGAELTIWRQREPTEELECTVKPLTWLFENERVAKNVVIRFITPTRLMVDGKPLRKPHFSQVFPFMLRRVTSMLYAHSGVEVIDEPTFLLAQARHLDIVATKMHWHDWRSLSGRQGLVVGGFLGEMVLAGQALEEVYWVLAVASLFGLGKAATYGAGRFTLCS